MGDTACAGDEIEPSAHARREWLALLQAEYDAFREKVIVAELNKDLTNTPTAQLDQHFADIIAA